MTTIYKKDSKFKIRSLEIWTDGDILYQKAGLLDGKKVTHSKVCTPKNIGKTNETTGKEQALAQASSLVVKKLKADYFNSIQEATSSNIILPMLANEYFKHKHKIKKENIALQPKLDGIRCLVFYDYVTNTASAISRTNNPINNIDHILEEIVSAVQSWKKNFIFDGELYIHGETFQEVVKLVKNKPDKKLIEYHIYDLIVTNTSFKDRAESIRMVLGENNNYLKLVPSIYNIIHTLDTYHDLFVEDYYEGMMVRDKLSMYKVKGRSDSLLKYKKFLDIALPIKEITPNEANPLHGTVWVDFNGNRQKTGAKLSHKDREELLFNKNDYIGKIAEIRYFGETDEGLMRFPIYHGIRIDK